jgi:hypothetical protein
MTRTSFVKTLASVLISPLLFAQTASAVAGKWHFVLDTEGGPREADADFTITDGKVSGSFGQAQAKGTATEDEIALEFEMDSEVGRGTMKMTGKQANGSLTGKWAFQSYDGTFKATRPTAVPKAG